MMTGRGAPPVSNWGVKRGLAVIAATYLLISL